MLAKCAKCDHVFETDRWGRQFCPQCGAELDLNPPPGTPAATPGPQQPATPQPPAAQQPAFEPIPAPSTGPAGAARCAVHGNPAVDTCTRCGSFVCRSCAASLNPAVCTNCAARVVDPDGPQDQRTPWEERATRGFFGGLFETVKQSLVNPIPFFARMRVDDTEGAVSYFWILYGFNALMSVLWQVALMAVGIGMNRAAGKDPVSSAIENFTGPAFMSFYGVGLAVLAPVALYIGAGIVHLGAMMVGANRNGFNATLRSVAYSVGPYVFAIIPFCGAYVAGIWVLVLNIIAIWKTHRTTGWRATGAVLLPALILGCCIGLAFAVVIGIFAARSGGFH